MKKTCTFIALEGSQCIEDSDDGGTGTGTGTGIERTTVAGTPNLDETA